MHTENVAQTSAPPGLLLRKAEAADRLRVSERTLERILGNGGGPRTTRIGTRVLIREDHLNAWIEALPESSKRNAA